MSKTEQMVVALEGIVKKPLTDEEKAGLEVWSKSFDLAHFIEGFPQEWKLFKEMLESYLGDFEDQWKRAGKTNPSSPEIANLDVLQAQLYGASHVVSAFIYDVEHAPDRIREVPEVVQEHAGELRSMPS
jgi:hypothetical protein